MTTKCIAALLGSLAGFLALTVAPQARARDDAPAEIKSPADRSPAPSSFAASRADTVAADPPAADTSAADHPAADTTRAETAAAPTPGTDDRATGSRAPRGDNIWLLTVGFRVAYVPNATFDAFASNDVLASLDAEVTRTVWRQRRFSLGAGLGGTIGGRSDRARTFESSLGVRRLSIPVEGRYHFAHWLYAGARVSPSLTVATATIRAGSESSSDTFALAGGDASIGARAGLTLGRSSAAPHLWLGADLGYSLTTSRDVRLAADSENEATSRNAIALGNLSLSGVFFRGNASISF